MKFLHISYFMSSKEFNEFIEAEYGEEYGYTLLISKTNPLLKNLENYEKEDLDIIFHASNFKKIYKEVFLEKPTLKIGLIGVEYEMNFITRVNFKIKNCLIIRCENNKEAIFFKLKYGGK